MLDESALGETKKVERFAGRSAAGVVGRFPVKSNRRFVTSRHQILDGHSHLRLLLNGLDDTPEPVLPSYSPCSKPLVVDVVLRDRRRDRIKVAGGEDVNDGARGFLWIVHSR
jgi:hypothetical protein